MKKLVLWLLKAYHRNLSWVFGPSVCRFSPTCSQYCYQSIAKYGILVGLTKTFPRLLKCHQWHPGGYDPVI